MKGKMLPKGIRGAVYFFSFALAVAATYFMLPKQGKFDRYFEEGKPWSYELLTAPVDFAIYKSEDVLKAEQDSALRDLEPYLYVDKDVEDVQLKALKDASEIEVGNRTADFIVERMKEVYLVGVMSLQDVNMMKETGVSKVVLIDKHNVGHKVDFDLFFTPKTAYDYVIAKAEMLEWIDENVLKSARIDTYIAPNIRIDNVKTEQAKAEIVSRVMLTSGMVQKGEKIIDRGEVVSAETYQILVSLGKATASLDEEESMENVWRNVGYISLIMIMYAMLFSYFGLFRVKVLESIRATLFMVMMVLGMLAMLWIVNGYFNISEYVVPMAMLPLVIRVFFDSRTAFFVHLVTIVMAANMVTEPLLFLILQFVAGMVAVSSLKNMNSRSQLLQSALLIFVSYVVTYIAAELSIGIEIEAIQWGKILLFAINAVALLFVYGLIFIIEKAFGFLSEVTLVELSNINSPLLMEFSEKCPGTFQHVLQVSNLSVEVAKKINANALLVRTGALYHDLGKMENPMYFTENQTGVNPLNDLSYEEAAQVIIRHVAAGVKIANKARLPYQIIEFITMHHGTSKTKYFYNSFKNEFPDKEIDDAKFTYPGPLPSTKETAILMMSDAVEAASRSLKSYTDESIDKLVEGVVNGQIADGQFKNAPISFRDVEIAKGVFKGKLKNIYHTRIQYPELKEQKKEEEKGGLSNLTQRLNGVRKPYRFTKK